MKVQVSRLILVVHNMNKKLFPEIVKNEIFVRLDINYIIIHSKATQRFNEYRDKLSKYLLK